MQNPMFFSVSGRLKYLQLIVDWNRSKKRQKLDPRIPHPLVNYNQKASSSYKEYYSGFVAATCLRELPALLKIANHKKSQDEFSLLDFGCGLGRLGFAFSDFFGKDLQRQYIGYEIHPEAYAFLKNAYKDYPNMTFLTNQIDLNDSYVELQQVGRIKGSPERKKTIAAKDIVLSDRVGKKVDLQFSHSVFTHMYSQPITEILKDITKLIKPDGYCVNTWLLVDQFAESSLRCGLTDRQLPYQRDGFYTYSKDNPLLCTAYKFDIMEDIYKKAGHKILDIQWGTWSGRTPAQTFTYQDVVISQPI